MAMLTERLPSGAGAVVVFITDASSQGPGCMAFTTRSTVSPPLARMALTTALGVVTFSDGTEETADTIQ